MDIKVSVIMPVYNAEKKLERCLESVVNQTLKELEIILVDDMSTDGSLKILKKYEEKYPDRVKIIELKQKGRAGGARNKGMEAAKGEYIGFVDADDFIDETMYEKLYIKAKETGADIVDAGYWEVQGEKGALTLQNPCCGITTPEKRELMIHATGFVWSKIYKKTLLKDNKIDFRSGVKLEDADFLMKTYLYVQNVANVPEVLYVYDNSETEDTWSIKKLDENEFFHMYELIKAIKELHDIQGFEYTHEVMEGIVLRIYAWAIQCCTVGGNMGPKELKLLKKLRDLKCSIVKTGYDNKFLSSNLSKDEIELIKYVDKTFLYYKK